MSVYRGGAAQGAAEERRRNLLGFAHGALVTLLLRRGNIMRGAARNRSGSAAKRGSNALPQGDEIVMVR
jgi:hypothetical protein